jgi:hypothetical protein
MNINTKPLSEMSATEREDMIQKFKTAAPKYKAVIYAQFESFKNENLSDFDREFLQELEADMRAVDFSKWETED